MVPFDHDLTRRGDFGFHHGVLSQAAHQDAGAPVDKSLGQARMQGVGQTVLYLTRDALPMLWIVKPIISIGDEGAGADNADPRGQRVDVAIDPVGRCDLPGNPVVRNASGAHDIGENTETQVGVGRRRRLAIIGNLADVPKPFDVGARLGMATNCRIPHRRFERQLVVRHRRARQARMIRQPVERGGQSFERRKIQRGVAPLQHV